MGRVSKGVKCSVAGCDEQAIRSLPTDRVASAGLKVGEVNRVYLCRGHYKEFKRGIKKEKMLERWRYRS